MHYDAVIIGAGMSGLAAGIRLAYFGKQVGIFERHGVCGGLNSFYTRGGRALDVGLHAVTNYAPPEARSAPLNKLLRQLRLSRDDFDLRPQRGSEIRFEGRCLRFTNDIAVLRQAIAEIFPGQVDGVSRLLAAVRAYDYADPNIPPGSARAFLAEHVGDPRLIEMLLCPLMYYGSAQERDLDLPQFVTLFKSVYLEGLARPLGGVRVILGVLVSKFRECGGKLRTACGVERIETDGQTVTGLVLQSGERITAEVVFSSAGYFETMRLCSDEPPVRSPLAGTGRLSFVESISCLEVPPAELGLDSSIMFFNDAETFDYARPAGLVDTRSGVICCPNNFAGHEYLAEGQIRLASLANYDRWAELDDESYAAAKLDCYERAVDRAVNFIPEFRDRVVFKDIFTPRTIERFTGHIDGAVYGSPDKRRDGRTRLNNLFICGTDQGLVGIVGALLSGISMVNLHVFQEG